MEIEEEKNKGNIKCNNVTDEHEYTYKDIDNHKHMNNHKHMENYEENTKDYDSISNYEDITIEYIIKNNINELKTTTSPQSLVEKYKNDIENMKILDLKMIDNIRKMSSEEKMEIILTYNSILDKLKYLLQQVIL
jgi:hypothetical protein